MVRFIKNVSTTWVIACILALFTNVESVDVRPIISVFGVMILLIFINVTLEQVEDSVYANLQKVKFFINMSKTVAERQENYRRFVKTLNPVERSIYHSICESGGGVDCEKLRDMGYRFPLYS